ncbi:polyprotein [Cucumis melo var. makuwa]|uniref:Polyprotein n=1 Tax=Cucumis melo var. makuwa TaxID=1194695 RepID=A0A5D3BUI9_CUCMM|nr:polyprotein [Cucumis melo var. makuwa]TYK02765.1 polyprotein [Cucumis melo var. makuwa]
MKGCTYKKFSIEECTQVPTANATRTIRKAHEHWVKANEKARAYILASLSETFEFLMKIKGQKGEANVATSTRKFHRGSTSGTKYVPSSTDTKKWKKKNGSQGNKANSTATKTSKKAKAAKGIYFHYNQKGHWKRNCSMYLVEKKKDKQDRGGEDMDLKFQNYLMKCGIEPQLSAPDQPDGVKPKGCKWIYKRKGGADGKVQTFKTRLVTKGYTQVKRVDYEETFPPVAMLKSIRILLSIAAYFDYEISQMDIKTSFLNGNLEETIYMQQPKGFITPSQEQKVCVLTDITQWLAAQFQMKDLGEAQFVLGIQIFNDRKNKTLALSQESYIDKIVVKYSMQNSKRGLLPFRNEVTLFKESTMLCPKTPQEVEEIRHIPYASAIGSLKYVMLCTRPDICSTMGIVSSVFTLNGGVVVWRSIKEGCIADFTMEAVNVAACEAAKEAI